MSLATTVQGCSYLSWRQYSSVKSLNTETCCTIVGLLSVLLVLSWVLPSGPISCRMKYELCYVTLFAAYSQPSSISYVGLRLQKKNIARNKRTNEYVCIPFQTGRKKRERSRSCIRFEDKGKKKRWVKSQVSWTKARYSLRSLIPIFIRMYLDIF
jgi:hypothetical protein